MICFTLTGAMFHSIGVLRVSVAVYNVTCKSSRSWPNKLRRVILIGLVLNRPYRLRTLAYVGMRASCQTHSWRSLNYDDDDVGLQHS